MNKTSKQDQIQVICTLAKRYGAIRIIVFGSWLDDQTVPNDIDIACEGIKGWDVYRFGGELEQALFLPVDIYPLELETPIKKYISERGQVVYESQ